MKPLLAPLLLALGCNGPSFGYDGQNIYKYFPLDGERDWSYANDASDVDWTLYVKLVDSEIRDGTEVATLSYQEKGDVGEVGEPLFSLEWSSDSNDGVLIHKYTDDVTGESTTFSPALIFGEHQMNVGESVETTTGGTTFTSTFVSSATCQTHWSTEDWDCLHFTLDDGGADLPFSGDWYIATNWGAAQMRFTGDTADWVLTEANYD